MGSGYNIYSKIIQFVVVVVFVVVVFVVVVFVVVVSSFTVVCSSHYMFGLNPGRQYDNVSPTLNLSTLEPTSFRFLHWESGNQGRDRLPADKR